MTPVATTSEPTFDKPLQLPLEQTELDRINAHLRTLEPAGILSWGVAHLPNLFQTTAFGLTGLATLDMLSKTAAESQQDPPPLIFVDTLYHFPETLALVRAVEERYGRTVAVYKPEGCDNAQEFERKHGEKLWERDEESYDYHVKVEPARRAYEELNVKSVITGRRASQGAARASLQPLEVDGTGLLKLNPFCAWSFAQVDAYIKENNVPKNALLDQGYRSVGDWHSTQKTVVKEGQNGDEAERAGRWAGRTEKTECGLHTDYFAMRMKMMQKKKEEEARQKEAAAATENGTNGTTEESIPAVGVAS